MLTFFRRIRKGLLDGGATSKYLLYAIGEIALVVIGILIALQINNWNSNIKQTIQLHNYLRSIQSNIQADLISIDFIQAYRDSSASFSNNYLRIAKKDKITVDDFNMIQNSNYKVYYDRYFESRKSGFEALKNSGFIEKLNGIKIEELLNEYYYIVDKIREREESLYHTIETLENVAMTEMFSLRMFDIQQSLKNQEAPFLAYQKDVKELLNTPSMKSANFRNRGNFGLQRYYKQIEQLANDLLLEIEKTVNIQAAK